MHSKYSQVEFEACIPSKCSNDMLSIDKIVCAYFNKNHC